MTRAPSGRFHRPTPIQRRIARARREALLARGAEEASRSLVQVAPGVWLSRGLSWAQRRAIQEALL